MKAKYALIALLAITFWGCDDNTAGLGLGMFPESDRDINGKLSTFDVTTESVHAGKIYAMTNVGYVGKFTDETFGTYQAGFLAELNCPSGMTFPGVYDGTALDEKKKATRVMVGDDNEDNKEYLQTLTLIATLTYECLARKMIIEKLIDSLPKEENSKDKSDKNKSDKNKTDK